MIWIVMIVAGLITYSTGFSMFNDMIVSIEDDVTKYVLRAQIRDNMERVQVAKPTSTSSGKEEIKRKPRTTTKVGRNDPCPCGSGKKYKNCCARSASASAG